MKPLRDTLRRTLYVVIVVLALLALLAAFLDNAFNEQKLQMPLLGALVVLLLMALLLFLHTELAYRSIKAAEATLTPAGAEPATATESEWAEVAPVDGAWTEDSAATEAAPTADAGAEPALAPMTAPVKQDWTTTVKTRLVCSSCKTYFTLDIPTARPQVIDCPSCSARVLLKGGPLHNDPPRTVECRSCKALNEVVDVASLASFICISCGKPNKLQTAASQKPKKASRKKSATRRSARGRKTAA